MLLRRVFKELGNVVSSEYIVKLNISLACEKSLTLYMINNSDPMIEPYGTPIVIAKMSDSICSISIYCFQFYK